MSKAAANPFNPKLVFILIAAGVIGFGALLLVIAYGGNMGSARDGRAHALSVAATGYKGLVDLVGQFRTARIVRDPTQLEGEDLLVVAVEDSTRPEQLYNLLERRQGRATLLILPKWLTTRDPAHRGWVRSLGTGAPVQATEAIGKGASLSQHRGPAPATARGEGVLAGVALPVPAQAQVIDGTALEPLAGLDDGALVARIGDQPHYVVADPDLLNNQGLRDPARARAALALIDALNATGATGVDFDVTINGFGRADRQPSLLRTAFEPPFLAMTLALLAAALLAGLHGAFRFGPARQEERAFAFGKAALVENSAGLIRLARREARLGGAYADVLRQDIARAANAPGWLQGEALDAYLDRMDRSGDPFSQRARRLVEANDRQSLMAAARALYQWKKDVIP